MLYWAPWCINLVTAASYIHRLRSIACQVTPHALAAKFIRIRCKRLLARLSRPFRLLSLAAIAPHRNSSKSCNLLEATQCVYRNNRIAHVEIKNEVLERHSSFTLDQSRVFRKKRP